MQDELLSWNDADARKWSDALQPLASELSKLTVTYLSKLVYPIRVGEHTNLAFGLSMMYDYAKPPNDTALSRAIQGKRQALHYKDENCPFGWEPGAAIFKSLPRRGRPDAKDPSGNNIQAG